MSTTQEDLSEARAKLEEHLDKIFGTKYTYKINSVSAFNDIVVFNVDTDAKMVHISQFNDTDFHVRAIGEPDDSEYKSQMKIGCKPSEVGVGIEHDFISKSFPEGIEPISKDHQYMKALEELMYYHDDFNITFEQAQYAMKAFADERILQKEFEDT